MISAWAVGSRRPIGWLKPRPTTSPSITTRAPTGTSPAGARLARQIQRQPHEFAVIHGADYGIAAGIGLP
jgi:hypothetical protein